MMFMKKYIIILTLLFAGCRTVQDWNSEPVLHSDSYEAALTYRENSLDLRDIREELESVMLNMENDFSGDEALLLHIQELIRYRSVAELKLSDSWDHLEITVKTDLRYHEALRSHYYFKVTMRSLDSSRKLMGEFYSLLEPGELGFLENLISELRNAAADYIIDSHSDVDVLSAGEALKNLEKSLKKRGSS